MTATGVVGLVGIAVGIGGFVTAADAADDAGDASDGLGTPDHVCHPQAIPAALCADLDAANADDDRFTNMGIIGLIVGGAGLLTSGILLGVELSSGDGGDATTARVIPTLGGFLVHGRF